MIRGESRRASGTPGMLSNLASYPQTKPQTFYLALHALLSAPEVCLALMEIGSSSNQSSHLSPLSQLTLTYSTYDVP